MKCRSKPLESRCPSLIRLRGRGVAGIKPVIKGVTQGRWEARGIKTRKGGMRKERVRLGKEEGKSGSDEEREKKRGRAGLGQVRQLENSTTFKLPLQPLKDISKRFQEKPMAGSAHWGGGAEDSAREQFILGVGPSKSYRDI